MYERRDEPALPRWARDLLAGLAAVAVVFLTLWLVSIQPALVLIPLGLLALVLLLRWTQRPIAPHGERLYEVRAGATTALPPLRTPPPSLPPSPLPPSPLPPSALPPLASPPGGATAQGGAARAREANDEAALPLGCLETLLMLGIAFQIAALGVIPIAFAFLFVLFLFVALEANPPLALIPLGVFALVLLGLGLLWDRRGA